MNWFRERATQFTGEVRFDEPLSKHTYYRIGGPAPVFAFPKTREDLALLGEGVQATGMPYFVLGSGSNLLVSDEGFAGLVIRATRLNLGIEVVSESGTAVRVRTGGSVAVSTLLRRAATDGWMGLELLAGVPGSIGGVVTMNAGTHLGEAKDRLRRVEVIDFSQPGLPTRVFTGDELKFEYRRNHFLPEGCVVWSADWDVTLDAPAKVKALIDETLARRKASQPVEYPSCGSVFKNPYASGMRSWQVIEKLGLRGHRLGDAQFSEKHPNFIVNLGQAKAADVIGLIRLAKTRAQAELGVTLEEEVMFLDLDGLRHVP